MDIICNPKSIDNTSWGHPSAPLLPKTLRELWKTERLPDWVILELNLRNNATYADLGADIGRTTPITTRIKNFLSILISTRADLIKDVRSFDRPWPVGLKIAYVPWTQRTINCLVRRGLINNEQQLTNLTFGYLFNIKNMGSLSILDFCCTLEASINRFEGSAKEIMEKQDQKSPSRMIGMLEEALSYTWTEQISHKDPRFARMLPLGKETIKHRIENILSEPDLTINVLEVGTYCSAIADLKTYVNNYEKKPLEVSLNEYLQFVSHLEGDRLRALANRFGCSGHEPASLEECGRKIGVTRERFRQIQSAFMRRLPRHPIFMPELDSALHAMEEAVPVGVNEAKSLLRAKGISLVDFHPRALLETAKLFGRDTDLTITVIRGNVFVTTEKSNSLDRRITTIARNLAGQSGVTNILAVTEEVNERMGQDIAASETMVFNLLKKVDIMRFLDDAWFWASDLQGNRNRLLNVTNKILSVISPQTVTNLRDGIKRQYRWRAYSQERYRNLVAPPLSALKEFYVQHNDFSVEGEFVASRKPLSYREVLSDVDVVLVEALRSSPTGLLDRWSLLEQCKRRGVNENTFSIYLSYSPVIEHVDIDIWKLRGAMVDPAAVDAMRRANQLRPREKRIIQYGWDPEGKLWVAARIPKSAYSLVIGCPSAITKYLAGKKFLCYAKHGMRECGTISINDAGVSYGYGAFIRRYGIDENDILLVEFDLANQIVTLATTDDEFLDE